MTLPLSCNSEGALLEGGAAAVGGSCRGMLQGSHRELVREANRQRWT
jgi:hypothetical protein